MNADSDLPGFRILRTLSETALAHVYLVESPDSEVPFVLKVLRAGFTSDPEIRGRFADEAKLCQELSHPNVVRCVGSGQLPDGRLYISTEFLEGEDLRGHLMAEGVLSADALVRLVLPLLDALQYVHGRGVVHRDLRPENIFLEGGLRAQRPKLIDFGLALFQGFRSVQTAVGALVSRPEYVAPECIGGHRADARSDLYALGVVMYEALTGLPPYVDQNYGRLLHKHMWENPARLPKESAHLLPIIERCLTKDPRFRFQTAGELALALEDFGVLLSVQVPRAFSTGEPPTPRIRPGHENAGDVIGNYRLERLIGNGGVGRVFVARHLQLGRQVALKTLKPEFASRSDVVQRFFQEALAANQINHEHIVEIHDFVTEPGEHGIGRSYCVMELLDGETLADRIARRPLEIRKLVGIAEQICDALEAAHRVGVIHRDVKPENIFLTRRSGEDDFMKLLDFGVAKLKAGLGNKPLFETTEGLVVGTPAYMSPEQASGRETDHRTDLYSLGTVLYEALAGRTPFQKEDFVQLAVEISHHPAPALPETTPSGEPIPPELRSMVFWCLEKHPECRPQSASALRDALRQMKAPSPVALPLDDVEELAFRPSSFRKLGGGLAAAGLLAATGVATYALTRTAPHPGSPLSGQPAPVAPAATVAAPDPVTLPASTVPQPAAVPPSTPDPATRAMPDPVVQPEVGPQAQPVRPKRTKRRPPRPEPRVEPPKTDAPEPRPRLDPDGVIDPYAL